MYKSFFFSYFLGVYLSLNGKVYGNNSVIPVIDIGETKNSIGSTQNNGLQCITDRKPCCRSKKRGKWFLNLDEGKVDVNNTGELFYRNRGRGDGTVNLNRKNSSKTSLYEDFCCEVPNMKNDTQILCVKIGKGLLLLLLSCLVHCYSNIIMIFIFIFFTTVNIIIQITESGKNIVGEKYILECAVNREDVNVLKIDWLHSINMSYPYTNDMSSVNITMIGSTRSQLILDPLQESRKGTITCLTQFTNSNASAQFDISVNCKFIITIIN